MSTTGRQESSTPEPSAIAAQLREADFVHVVSAQTGDGVAAAGQLVNALDAQGCPYQTSVVGLPASVTCETDADVTVSTGRPTAQADVTLGTGDRTASESAFEVAAGFGSADPVLALAGHLTTGKGCTDRLAGALAEEGIERRPGVSVPTADQLDGLTHSTLFHASFSGMPDEARDIFGHLDAFETDRDDTRRLEPDEWRQLASALALVVAREGTERGAIDVERSLRPYVAGPFETVGGYGDVLDAVAYDRPGRALTLAVACGDTSDALDCWREHGTRVHGAIREANTGRYNGLFVVRCPGETPLEPVARLLAAYRAPEPVTLAIADGRAVAVANSEGAVDVGTTMAETATALDGTGDGTRTRARAVFEGEASEFVLEFRDQCRTENGTTRHT